MNILQVLAWSYLIISCVSCGPVSKTSFYDAIVQRCPFLKSDTQIKQLFHTCSEWKNMTDAKINLTDKGSVRDVQCLLLFYAFTQYCNQTKEIKIPSQGEQLPQELNTICDNQEIIPPQVDSKLYEVLANKTNCRTICIDDVGVGVSPFCSLAYYYKNLTHTKSHLLHVPKKTSSDAGQQVTSSSEVKGQQNPTNVEVADERNLANVKDEEHNVEVTEERNPTEVKDEGHQEQITNVQPPHPEQPGIAEKIKPGQDTALLDSELPAPQEAKVPKKKDNDMTPETSKVAGQNSKIDNSKKITNTISSQTPSKVPAFEQPNIEEADNLETVQNSELQNDDADIAENNEDQSIVDNSEKLLKPAQTEDTETQPANYSTEMEGDSYFFTYFMLFCIIFIVGYVCYHNKQKILALILEGRKGKRQYRGRRPNSANYHKLDSNLEEAITSSCNKNTNNVIY